MKTRTKILIPVIATAVAVRIWWMGTFAATLETLPDDLDFKLAQRVHRSMVRDALFGNMDHIDTENDDAMAVEFMRRYRREEVFARLS